MDVIFFFCTVSYEELVQYSTAIFGCHQASRCRVACESQPGGGPPNPPIILPRGALSLKENLSKVTRTQKGPNSDPPFIGMLPLLSNLQKPNFHTSFSSPQINPIEKRKRETSNTQSKAQP